MFIDYRELMLNLCKWLWVSIKLLLRSFVIKTLQRVRFTDTLVYEHVTLHLNYITNELQYQYS